MCCSLARCVSLHHAVGETEDGQLSLSIRRMRITSGAWERVRQLQKEDCHHLQRSLATNRGWVPWFGVGSASGASSQAATSAPASPKGRSRCRFPSPQVPGGSMKRRNRRCSSSTLPRLLRRKMNRLEVGRG